eukprot:COSAG02_NODE_28622_length_586_cov_0.739220_1_plen_83_part_00
MALPMALKIVDLLDVFVLAVTDVSHAASSVTSRWGKHPARGPDHSRCPPIPDRTFVATRATRKRIPALPHTQNVSKHFFALS